MRGRPGFSFIELLTVVALIAILVTAAVPAADSLFRRNRETQLKETLLILRHAIREYPRNGVDDDGDGLIDEDPRGDSNRDGYPGLRGADDNNNGAVDEDRIGKRRINPTFLADGRPNPGYTWSYRADDDEDGILDEEAFAGDLNELATKMLILRNRIPVDPITGEASWRVDLARINNDRDWTLPANLKDPVGGSISASDPTTVWATGRYDGVGPIVLSPAVRRGTEVISFQGEPADVLKGSVGVGTPLVELIDEDPRNGIDDDGDGLIDEDPPEVLDVHSWNESRAIDGTRYSEW